MAVSAFAPPLLGTLPELHVALDAINRWRLSPGVPDGQDAPLEELERKTRDREILFVEDERRRVSARAAAAPLGAKAFVAWFEDLARTGPGQHDPLFDWLESDASRDEMRWFLRQEVAGEAGFEDLVALTQVKLPRRAKLELARNYWDEMGQGHAAGMHGPMLARLSDDLGAADPSLGALVTESLALGNLLVALAVHRRYAYHSIGALGAIELTAPARAEKVNAGLKRLGVGGEARRYFALHATLDVKHSRAWNDEVLCSLVESDPELARPIAEGALMRLEAGAACFARYRRHFGVGGAARRT